MSKQFLTGRGPCCDVMAKFSSLSKKVVPSYPGGIKKSQNFYVHLFYVCRKQAIGMKIYTLYQIRRPYGLAFVIYFWWLGELLLLYI
jgi:hypothetical protein